MIAGATERKRVLKDANKSETDRQKSIAITVCAPNYRKLFIKYIY